MSDPADYIARIRAKGLAATGVIEEIARGMHSRRGQHVMLIVEAKIEETSDNADGQHKVALTIQQVEPAVDDRLDEHLRGLCAAPCTTSAACTARTSSPSSRASATWSPPLVR